MGVNLNFEVFIICDLFTMRLPITPEQYSISLATKIEPFSATSVGNIYVYGHDEPINLELSSFFTTQNYYFVKSSTLPVTNSFDYIKHLDALRISKKPCRVLITCDDGTRLNKLFKLGSISYTEDSKNIQNITFILKFFEHTDLKATLNTQIAINNRPESVVANPTHYTVIAGDNLTKIARKFYNNNDWKKIYDANIDVIGKNPNLIFAGQVLKI